LVDEHCQTQIPGIFACGNVLQVHDLVDYVSEEAERAGLGAVQYVKDAAADGEVIRTLPGNGVRYVLPQKVSIDQGDVDLFLRVVKPYGKVRFTVRSGEEILATATRLKAAPGEMEKLSVKAEKLALAKEPITVELEEVQ